jgi:hypothetical protein
MLGQLAASHATRSRNQRFIVHRQSFNMGLCGLLPNQASLRNGPDRIDLAQGCSLKQVILFDHMLVALFFE